MSHDLVITGGTVVDGTGAAPLGADVAITDGRITEVGAVSGPAARRIDADRAEAIRASTLFVDEVLPAVRDLTTAPTEEPTHVP